jgi:hypothetical protein
VVNRVGSVLALLVLAIIASLGVHHIWSLQKEGQPSFADLKSASDQVLSALGANSVTTPEYLNKTFFMQVDRRIDGGLTDESIKQAVVDLRGKGWIPGRGSHVTLCKGKLVGEIAKDSLESGSGGRLYVSWGDGSARCPVGG